MCSGVESDEAGDCPMCGMSLEHNPAHSRSSGKVTYTCPMHPQIEQDHPGDCPICGMALEPKAAAPEAQADSEGESLARKFWLGVILTGSVTSSNALFGNLQVVTANRLGLSPILTASANAAGGVMGKMISLQSIAVAVAATGMALSDEGKLFRVMLRHSIVLVTMVGLLALIYAYWLPYLVPQV